MELLDEESIRIALEKLSIKKRENIAQVVTNGIKSKTLNSFKLIQKAKFVCEQCGKKQFKILFRGFYHGRKSVPYVICLNCGWMGWDALFSNGFEEGSLSGWTGTSITGGDTLEASSVKAHNGIFSLHIKALANGNADYVYETISSTATAYAKCYFCFMTKIGGYSNSLFWLYSGGTQLAQMSLVNPGYSNAYFTLYDVATTTSYQSASFNLVLGTWYYVELKFTASATVGEITGWFGNTTLSETGINTGTNNVTSVRVGAPYAWNATEFYVDCVVIDNAYIGPEADSRALLGVGF